MSLIVESYLEDIQEAKKQSRHTTSRKTKITRATSQMSTAMARKKNDPTYKQMKRYCDMCKQLREKIHKKYKARNISRARK